MRRLFYWNINNGAVIINIFHFMQALHAGDIDSVMTVRQQHKVFQRIDFAFVVDRLGINNRNMQWTVVSKDNVLALCCHCRFSTALGSDVAIPCGR